MEQVAPPPLPTIFMEGQLNQYSVMIDLETGGIRPNAPIAAIGAVRFDSTGSLLEGPEHQFYRAINLVGPLQPAPDASTMYWWMKQSDEARAAFCEGENGASLGEALWDLRLWLAGVQRPDFVHSDVEVVFTGDVWVRGDRDSVWLDEAYRRLQSPLPYRYSKVRDQRSIVEFGRERGADMPEWQGTAHNALDDAIYQVKCLQAVLRRFPTLEQLLGVE